MKKTTLKEDLMEISSSFKENITQLNGTSEHLTNEKEDKSFLKTALAWRGSVTPKVLSRVLTSGIYTLVVTLVGAYFPSLFLSITPFEYCGVVLGLLLVARVNAGMDRWWEARKIWGSIVNQSRNLAIIGNQYSDHKSPYLKEFLSWVAIWPYAMKQHLRDEKNLQEAKNLLPNYVIRSIEKAEHMPMYIGTKIATLLKKMKNYGLDDFSFLRAERERALLIDAIGACERIKSTPIPLVLAIKTRRFIFIFLVLLPFALLEEVNWLAPFIVMLTAYPLLSLDEIGIELQSPFSQNTLSHLPLDQICQNIKNNVLYLDQADDDDEKEAQGPVKLESQGKFIVLDYNFDKD